MGKQLVAYYRVSTNRQGDSGLGLEAQRRSALQFASSSDHVIIREFVEIESGKKSRRPNLDEALVECRRSGATLLIAKLDRLARNVHFISGLLESNVSFIAADMPNADRFMLHVYAAMAEEEARRISERTKSALLSARNRGVALGENAKDPTARNSHRADEFARAIGPEISELRELGLSIRKIADRLNFNEVRSYRDGRWHPTAVHRIWKRYNSLTSGYTN